MDNPLPVTLTDRFACILAGICQMVAARGGRDHAAAPMVVLVWSRLRRMVTRFTALVARMEAGTLRAPQPRARPSPAEPRSTATAPALRLPSGHLWLVRFVQETIQHSGQVQHLLTDPDMIRLLALAPQQAGRIIRPLCRMLGVPAPEAAKLPPRLARRRKSKVGAKRRIEPPEPPRFSIPGWPRPPTPFRKRVRKRRTGACPYP